MDRKIKALISAVVTFISFAAIPFILIMLIPRELVEYISKMNINLAALQNEIILIGVVLSALSFFKNVFDEASLRYLAASILSTTAWLLYVFIFLGLGNLQRLGMIDFSIEFEHGLNKATIDFRFFVYLSIVSVALKIIHTLLKFREARIEKEKLRLAGQAAPS
ncbi:hypothetical protein KEJ47_08900 [Candidatus Bathyarchaeota archaeon]|nr:hypothetical protein [Candidatus Bathyarchaeota archaeon]